MLQEEGRLSKKQRQEGTSGLSAVTAQSVGSLETMSLACHVSKSASSMVQSLT